MRPGLLTVSGWHWMHRSHSRYIKGLGEKKKGKNHAKWKKVFTATVFAGASLNKHVLFATEIRELCHSGYSRTVCPSIAYTDTLCLYKLCIYVQNKVYFSPLCVHSCLLDWCVSQQGSTDTFNTGDWDTVCLFLTSDNLRTTRTRDAVSIYYDPRQPFLGRKK